jgi:KDO2-lipid IV(A) lauroyltransferase
MNFSLYILFLLLEKIIPLFPLRFIQRLARLKGLFFYYFFPIRKKVAYKNLKLAFPGKSESEINSIIKSAYVNVMTVIFEFFFLPGLQGKRLLRLLNPEDLVLLKEKLMEGKGLIIVSAHFGNWELTAYGCSLLIGEPFNVIVKEQSNKLMDRRINRIRKLGGNKMIQMSRAARDVLYLLRDNKIIAILGDQSAPKEGSVKVKFFTDDVPTFEGAARFALKTGAAVVFGISVRREDGSYKILLKDIDVAKYPEYNENNIKRLTQEHANVLEELIKQHPDHWLWFHKKFKNVLKY